MLEQGLLDDGPQVRLALAEAGEDGSLCRIRPGAGGGSRPLYGQADFTSESRADELSLPPARHEGRGKPSQDGVFQDRHLIRGTGVAAFDRHGPGLARGARQLSTISEG